MKDQFDLLPGEELHHLILDKLYILQKQDQFRFGVDAVLLANWAKIKRIDRVVDLGTGTGVIALLIAHKKEPQKVIGLEIQPEMAELAQRSVLLNQLEDRVEIHNLDLRQVRANFLPNSFTVVVSNPPYFPVKIGYLSSIDAKAVARHEVFCTLEDLVQAAAYLLGSKGRFVFIHRCERLSEIFLTLSKKGFEVKVMRLIQPRPDLEPNLVLIEAVKDAKPGLKIETNLIIYDEKGEYTPEVLEMYFGETGGERDER